MKLRAPVTPMTTMNAIPTSDELEPQGRAALVRDERQQGDDHRAQQEHERRERAIRHARQSEDLLDVDRDGDEDEPRQRGGRAGRGDEEVGPLAGA